MQEREQNYRARIQENLDTVLTSGFIPELPGHKRGKVREVYFTNDRVLMVASDRVSCFDRVLSRAIPYKGQVLNNFTAWAFEGTSDIVPNAVIESPDPNVVIQRRLPNSGFECVVRGYVWGSLASDYEKGSRNKSGIALPDGLLRYQKLETPMFTPTTKAETGHDEDITLEHIAAAHGQMLAERMRDTSIALFVRGAEMAQRRGKLLLDTKFEFGIENGKLVLIDECLTPDSSRYADAAEYAEKWPQIQAAMRDGSYKDVSALLKARPELKITEESKQFVRDVLIAGGYREGMPLPELTDEQVMETAWRYIATYEALTGRTFNFATSELSPKERIMRSLQRSGLAHGGCVVPIGASASDKEHWGKLEAALRETGTPFMQPFYASAHKETRKVLDFVERISRDSIEPVVFLTFAGRSNGLGPVVAGNTHYPVITCPPFSDTASYAVDIHSSLRMPSNLPMGTIIDPKNAVLFARRILEIAR